MSSSPQVEVSDAEVQQLQEAMERDSERLHTFRQRRQTLDAEVRALESELMTAQARTERCELELSSATERAAALTVQVSVCGVCMVHGGVC